MNSKKEDKLNGKQNSVEKSENNQPSSPFWRRQELTWLLFETD